MVGSLGTAQVKRAYKSVSLAAKGIPSLFVNTGSSQFADIATYPTMFSILPSYTMEAKILAKYLKEEMKVTEFTLVAQADEFGTEAQTGFAAAGLKPTTVITYGAGSVSSAAAAKTAILDKLGSTKTVVLFGTTDSTGYLLKALENAGKVGTYDFVVGSVGGDANTLLALKVEPATMNGIIAASFFPDAKDSTDEYVSEFMKINAEYNKGVSFDNVVLQGMNSAMLTVQALRAAGKDLTRKGLISAIEVKGSKFASAGLLPLNYSGSSHVGYNGYWIGKLNSAGELKPVGSSRIIYTTDSKTGAVSKSDFARPKIPAKGIPNNS
jgi:ABC-type branched-subunit amino acid transport system substrate-binding protein